MTEPVPNGSQRQTTGKKCLNASIGVETLGGAFTAVLERRACLPCKKIEVFSTGADDQSSIDIHVLQGNGTSVSDPGMRDLGRFTLTGIAPAPAGQPQIEVTFSVTGEGEFVLYAKDAVAGHGIEVAAERPGTGRSELDLADAVGSSALATVLKGIGSFSLVMTGVHLWRVGLARLEGPEGETWGDVALILAPYVIMGLISWGIYALGKYCGRRA